MKITKRQLRRIIKEVMEQEQESAFPDLSHPLIAPYANKMEGPISGRGGGPHRWFQEYMTYRYDAGGPSRQGITVYLLPDSKYTARVGGNFSNTISGRVGQDFDNPESAIEAALNSSPSGRAPFAKDILKKVGDRVRSGGYFGQD